MLPGGWGGGGWGVGEAPPRCAGTLGEEIHVGACPGRKREITEILRIWVSAVGCDSRPVPPPPTDSSAKLPVIPEASGCRVCCAFIVTLCPCSP